MNASEAEDSTTRTSSKLGLKTIRDPPSPHELSNPPMNIVFIHGLGGSSKGTWTDAPSGYFWPSWLPEIKGLENLRIMTFGYDSGWNKLWKPNNVLDISDFAKQLVNDLWLHYGEHGDVNVLHHCELNVIGTYCLCCAQHGRSGGQEGTFQFWPR
jgi:hypothetical protein